MLATVFVLYSISPLSETRGSPDARGDDYYANQTMYWRPCEEDKDVSTRRSLTSRSNRQRRGLNWQSSVQMKPRQAVYHVIVSSH